MSLKSVNHRGLDLHFHLPAPLDPLESEIRDVIKSGVARGHVQIQRFTGARRGGNSGIKQIACWPYTCGAFAEAKNLYDLHEANPI